MTAKHRGDQIVLAGVSVCRTKKGPGMDRRCTDIDAGHRPPMAAEFCQECGVRKRSWP